MTKQWSKYQQDIFRDVAVGQGHTVVEALAGSGKTTSIIEALKYIPPGNSWLLVAFNKKIAEDLRLKAPAGGEIRTLHSLGLKAITKSKLFKKVTINEDKVDNILSNMFGNDRQWKNAKYQLAKTVSLAKGYLASSPEEIDDIMDLHEIEPDQLDRQSFIKTALDTLKKCKEVTSVIDFDDMIWFPHVHAIKIPQYDRIFVDEAQDLNKAQIELILKTIKQPPKKKTAKAFSPSRIMAIGDRNQSLYGFRGADTKAIDNIINALGAKTLPLSVTYRCPIRVVQEARKLVPALESAPQAKAGKLDWITDREMFKLAQPGCFILSRTNAPMISLAMHFLKHRIPCNIQGRDIGLNLLNLIKLSKASYLKDFLSFLDRWSKAEMQRLQEKNKDTSQIADKVACFEALSEGCETLAELKATIEKLFDDTDDRNRIILSTVHRAKGLERDTVFVLNYTFVLGNSQEEKNIKYVAITRAKQELYFVYADKAEQPANEME